MGKPFGMSCVAIVRNARTALPFLTVLEDVETDSELDLTLLNLRHDPQDVLPQRNKNAAFYFP